MKKTVLLIISLIYSCSFAQDKRQALAKSLAEKGKVTEALTTIDNVIAENPPRASYYTDKIEYLAQAEQYELIMPTFEKALKIMPDSLMLYDMRGNYYVAMSQFDLAISDFSIGVKKAKDNAYKSHFLANRSSAKSHTRNFDGAYKDLKEALKLDSTNIGAYNNMAMVCEETHKMEEAFRCLNKVIEINPDFAPGYMNLGFCHQRVGHHEEAIKYFDTAIKMAPDEAFPYSNRSFSKLQLGDLTGAMADINLSLKLMPSNSYAYKNRALIYFKKDKFKLGCEDLNMAIQLGYTKEYGSEVETLIGQYCK